MIGSQTYRPSTSGFTLIEILITLVIVSVALLSLGSFAISIIDSGQQSRERLSAVHLAEQVLEFWQHDSNDFVPSIASDCVLTTGSSIPSPSITATCTPTTGVSMAHTVVASNTQASGPLPSNLSAFQSFTSAGLTLTPMTKVVTVSWSHKGTARSVYLTHLTAVQ
jgi:prepilin-type N-terminal cleavage/methylation domain-containing protein